MIKISSPILVVRIRYQKFIKHISEVRPNKLTFPSQVAETHLEVNDSTVGVELFRFQVDLED